MTTVLKDRDAHLALRMFVLGCDIAVIADVFEKDRLVIEAVIRAAMVER